MKRIRDGCALAALFTLCASFSMPARTAAQAPAATPEVAAAASPTAVPLARLSIEMKCWYRKHRLWKCLYKGESVAGGGSCTLQAVDARGNVLRDLGSVGGNGGRWSKQISVSDVRDITRMTQGDEKIRVWQGSTFKDCELPALTN